LIIRIKRVYDEPSENDGKRILVDRLWPRGLTKGNAKIDYWAKDLAPSTELRKWYNHDPQKWEEFKKMYFEELDSEKEGVLEFKNMIKDKISTLLFSSKELNFNNALALKEYLFSDR
jgi:uncharacterized protein YeaO (DUF488 family)